MKKEMPEVPWETIEINMEDKNNKFITEKGNKEKEKRLLIIGKTLQGKIIRAIDEENCHKGKEAIIAILQGKNQKQNKKNKKNKTYKFYSADMELMVEEHVSQCKECEVIETKRRKLGLEESEEGGKKPTIPEEQEVEVLVLGDSLHQGYATALRRLERWCWFPDMETKVRQ